MENLNLETFDPKKAELETMAEVSRSLKVTDYADETQIEAVHTHRILLKNTRVQLEKTGKALREDATKFAKAVIAKEKELIAIIASEEYRLEEIEATAKAHALKLERLRKLPERRERLIAVGWTPGTSEDATILEMDDVQFETLYTNVVARIESEKQAAIRAEQAKKEAELEARQKEIEAKEQAIRDKENAEAAEAKRLADIEKARAEGEAKAKADQERKEAHEKTLKERDFLVSKMAAEKLEKTKKYKAFLESHGWTEVNRGDFKIEETATGYVLYKRLGQFTK